MKKQGQKHKRNKGKKHTLGHSEKLMRPTGEQEEETHGLNTLHDKTQVKLIRLRKVINKGMKPDKDSS